MSIDHGAHYLAVGLQVPTDSFAPFRTAHMLDAVAFMKPIVEAAAAAGELVFAGELLITYCDGCVTYTAMKAAWATIGRFFACAVHSGKGTEEVGCGKQQLVLLWSCPQLAIGTCRTTIWRPACCSRCCRASRTAGKRRATRRWTRRATRAAAPPTCTRVRVSSVHAQVV